MFGTRLEDLFHPETGLQLHQKYCVWLLQLCAFMGHDLLAAFTYAFTSTHHLFIPIG